MKEVKYARLRQRMKQEGLKQKDLCEMLELSNSVVSQRLNGQRDFKISEAYLIMESMGIPKREFHIYFPPRGELLDTRRDMGKAMAMLHRPILHIV